MRKISGGFFIEKQLNLVPGFVLIKSPTPGENCRLCFQGHPTSIFGKYLLGRRLEI